MTLTLETDAELEEFIDKAVNDCCGSQECEGAPILYDWEDVDKVAKEVASFSAKRAREKAIEEWSGKNAVEIILYLMIKSAETMVDMNADTMKQSCELKAIGKRIDMECSLKSL